MNEKPVYIIDGDMPPLAETGQRSLLPTDQSVGAYKGAEGQIYGAVPLPKPGDYNPGATSVASGMIPVAASDLPATDIEPLNITAWFGKSWVKWGAAGVLAGAVGHVGYQAWRKRRGRGGR